MLFPLFIPLLQIYTYSTILILNSISVKLIMWGNILNNGLKSMPINWFGRETLQQNWITYKGMKELHAEQHGICSFFFFNNIKTQPYGMSGACILIVKCCRFLNHSMKNEYICIHTYMWSLYYIMAILYTSINNNLHVFIHRSLNYLRHPLLFLIKLFFA